MENNYVKFIDETTVEPAGRVIRLPGHGYIANPRPVTLLAHGYKPLVSDAQPETGEGEHLEPRYEETEDAVVRHWSVVHDGEPQGGGDDE